MPKLDLSAIPLRQGSAYPAPFNERARQRLKQALGQAGGLTDIGVNLTRLFPGEWSSQRHWHTEEDEFVFVLEGEVTLITDAGEESLRAGECAAFPKGVANGHHLINRSAHPALYLEIGSNAAEDVVEYPDIDMRADERGYARKNGERYDP